MMTRPTAARVLEAHLGGDQDLRSRADGIRRALVLPVVVFILLGSVLGAAKPARRSRGSTCLSTRPILAAVLIALGAVQSLVAIMAIYREGGILKRLRATPLSPVTILGAHVLVKLGFTAVQPRAPRARGQAALSGRDAGERAQLHDGRAAQHAGILSLGFVIASLVPTARFAQPISAVVLYPMLAVSGLFFPFRQLPAALRAVAYLLPTTHAVALLQGVWDGSGWGAHWVNAAALLALFLAVFRALDESLSLGVTGRLAMRRLLHQRERDDVRAAPMCGTPRPDDPRTDQKRPHGLEGLQLLLVGEVPRGRRPAR